MNAAQHRRSPAARYRVRAGALAAAVCFVGCLSPRRPAEEVGVGVVSRTVVDDARERRIAYEVFYPAGPDAQPSPETHAFIYTEWLARDAAYVGGGRPVLLLSHGTGGTVYDLFWLARRAVAQGFVVLSVRHPGDTWDERTPLSSLQVWERPEDVRRALDDLAADEVWGPRLDLARVAAAGHSVGAFTVLSLVGLRYDIDRAYEECFTVRMVDPTCVWVRQGEFDFHQIDYTKSGRSQVDPRVRAVIALTPAVAEAASLASAEAITQPVLVVGARRDQLTPFELHAKAYARWVPTASLLTLDEADHYTPVNACNAMGKAWLENCQEVEGARREDLQARIADRALGFVEEVFRDHAAGGEAAPSG